MARSAPQKLIPVIEAKERVLQLIADDLTVAEAMSVVNRKTATYEDWRKHDQEFKRQVDGIRLAKSEIKSTGRPEVPDFPEFCAEWLHQPLFPHQMRMLDVIEGRPPRDLHEAMTYRAGDAQRMVINVPPEHAKSTTFTINYTVWRIHKDPDIRVVIMSQTRQLAQDFLYEIKLKLTSRIYREMHLRFAPVHEDGTRGWKDPDNSWTSDRIYVQGKGSTVEGIQKDPTVQAIGLSGQIYGRRADLIFLDDIITTKNAREIDKQMLVLDREIESRLPSQQEGGGQLVVLGTRVAPQDLYRALIDVDDADDEPVWTYFRQPAVLSYGDGDSSTWTTLWPEKWNGKSLAKKKRKLSWSLVYQQLTVDDDMTFQAEAVQASVNGGRFPGVMSKDGRNHRERGMDGLWVIGGLDPGGSLGHTSMVVMGVDPETQKRWVLDGFNKSACSPAELTRQVKLLTEKYAINEWVIERNGLQTLLTRDADLVQWLRSRSCRLVEHHTNSNKYDSDFGIATMAPLFESCGAPDPKSPSGRWKRTPQNALIELPSERQNAWVNDLIQQLIVWMPDGMAQKTKTDLVMALWFCEIGAKKLLARGKKKQHYRESPFTTTAAKGTRRVINLAEIRRQRQDAALLEGSG